MRVDACTQKTEPIQAEPASANTWGPVKAATLLAVVCIAWVVFDRATKMHFDQFALGEHIAGPFFDMFEFTLVHNTGAAWGLFDNATFALGVFSLVISVVIAVLAVVFARRSTALLSVASGLIAAGGIGNAIDRFTQGYVVDFINLTFMDFPVFNIADIGVTCGFVLLAVALLFFWREGDSATEAKA